MRRKTKSDFSFIQKYAVCANDSDICGHKKFTDNINKHNFTQVLHFVENL